MVYIIMGDNPKKVRDVVDNMKTLANRSNRTINFVKDVDRFQLSGFCFKPIVAYDVTPHRCQKLFSSKYKDNIATVYIKSNVEREKRKDLFVHLEPTDPYIIIYDHILPQREIELVFDKICTNCQLLYGREVIY